MLAAMNAPYLVTLPAMYTDLHTGALLEAAELTADQWTQLGQGHSELGRVLLDEFGVRQMFHPHADAHVDDDVRTTRFLELTDPANVSLCLDTGYIAYAGGENRALVARHPDRIGFVHLRSIDPTVLAKVRAEGMSFAQGCPGRRDGRAGPGRAVDAGPARRPERPRRPADGDCRARPVPGPPDVRYRSPPAPTAIIAAAG